ncbi:MAG: hypothetical protein H6905_04150 [Hyphomicrobiales bacterium]|nr:hypothetical protein [Hyphomicrobiales bacterium]
MTLPTRKTKKNNRIKLKYNLQNYIQLLLLKNKHRGKQCIILATGPSLNLVDLSLLEGHEFVIGLNGAYRKFNKFKYYFCSCPNYFLANQNDVYHVDAEKLFLSSHIPYQKRENFIYIRLHETRNICTAKKFSWNVLKTLYWGPTVLLDIVLPTVLWMGFSEIVLLGADYSLNNYRHAYSEKHHNTLRTTNSEEEMISAHRSFDIVKETLSTLKQAPRIINCSPLSDLRCFPKKNLDEVIRLSTQ